MKSIELVNMLFLGVEITNCFSVRLSWSEIYEPVTCSNIDFFTCIIENSIASSYSFSHFFSIFILISWIIFLLFHSTTDDDFVKDKSANVLSAALFILRVFSSTISSIITPFCHDCSLKTYLELSFMDIYPVFFRHMIRNFLIFKNNF